MNNDQYFLIGIFKIITFFFFKFCIELKKLIKKNIINKLLSN